MFTMSWASGSSSRVAVSSSSDTRMGNALPIRAMRATRAGWRPAQSSATSEPML
jgi:hypothetical protein